MIRNFQPRLDLNLSVYRPWGVVASTIADAFTDHLIQNTSNYMNAVNAGINEMVSA
jgi:hypothetical protein